MLFVAILFHSTSFAEKKVLHLGDSQSYLAFGDELYRLLRLKDDIKIESHARGGATPDWYQYGLEQPEPWGAVDRFSDGLTERTSQMKTPPLSDLISNFSPDLVVIQLGDNFFRMDWDEGKTAAVVSAFLTEYRLLSPNSKCVWVSPFSGYAKDPKRLETYFNVILDESKKANCDVIDSRTLITYPGKKGDGMHLNSAGPEGIEIAKTWAEKITQSIVKYF